VIQPSRSQGLLDAGLGDQAAIAHQRHMLQPQALLQLAHLRSQSGRIAGVAGEDLDRHRAAVGGAQQAIDDLRLVFLAVPAIADVGQFATPSLDIARRDVIEHQRAAREMPLGQLGLDPHGTSPRAEGPRLACAQPVQSGVQLVLVDFAQSQNLTQAEGGGRRRQRLGGGQLGVRGQQPRHNHGQHQIAAAVASWPQHAVESDGAQRAERGGDMTVRQGPARGERRLARRHHNAALEHRPEPLDQRLWPVGQVAQGALFDPAVLAVGFAQQNGGGVRCGSGRLRCTWPHPVIDAAPWKA
jgi:hypothetical protein